MSDEYRKISTANLLRQVASARAKDELDSVQGEWWACVMRAQQRVEIVVERYRLRNWIPAADCEDVVQLALLRGGRRLIDNLDDLSEDAFFAAMVQVAKFQCRDSARAHMARDQHQTGSLDEPAAWSDGDDSPGRYDKPLGKQATEKFDRDEDILDAERRVNEAIPKLKDIRAQKILVMQRHGMKDAQIAEELGITITNVQQIRSRALKELRGLIDP